MPFSVLGNQVTHDYHPRELNVWWERQNSWQHQKSVDAVIETSNLRHELRAVCPRGLRISSPVIVSAWVILFKIQELHRGA